MNFARVALLSALFAAALAPVAQAQRVPSPLRYIERSQSVGLFAGTLQTETTLRGTRDTLDIGPRSAPVFGLRYGIRFEGPLSGEVVLGYVPSEREVFRRDTLATGVAQGEATSVGTADLPLVLAEGALRFNLSGPRTYRGFAPFVLAGGGLLIDAGGDDGDVPAAQRVEFGPTFSFSLGGGTDLFLNERFSLRADVRDQIYRLQLPAALRSDGGGEEESEWKNNLLLSVGAAFHF